MFPDHSKIFGRSGPNLSRKIEDLALFRSHLKCRIMQPKVEDLVWDRKDRLKIYRFEIFYSTISRNSRFFQWIAHTLTPFDKFYPFGPSNFISLDRLVFALSMVNFRFSGPSFFILLDRSVWYITVKFQSFGPCSSTFMNRSLGLNFVLYETPRSKLA